MTPRAINGIRCTKCRQAFKSFSGFEAHDCATSDGGEAA